MKTISAKKEDLKKDWYVVDADGKVLGRLASQVAAVLRGKHKPIYTPHVDTGDFVVVVNAGKIRITGTKVDDKEFYHHSGYPDGLKKESLRQYVEEKPDELIKRTVWGMLPKNKLGKAMLKKLKDYSKQQAGRRLLSGPYPDQAYNAAS